MSSPPPPIPTTAATADFLKSVARQRPQKHSHPAIYQTLYNTQPSTTLAFTPPTQRQQPPHHSNSRSHHQQPPVGGGVVYPVASSGRGFLPKHQQPNSNQNVFPPRSVSGYPNRPYGFSNSDIPGQQLLNPSSAHLQQNLIGGSATGVPASANLKVVGQSSVAADSIFKNTRDNNGDDAFIIIRDRKVHVSEGDSLYAQCRSWLKNGSTIESQPQRLDYVKSLPKPRPASIVEAINEDDVEMEEKTEDVDKLSAKELLQQHVKHAKKVRARLRNQRLQRIERYKDRLALLLPPVVDQHPHPPAAAS